MAAPKMFDLSGEVAVVTGGNGGIGRGIALGLAEAGASVAILARNEEKNRAVVDELAKIGVPAISAPLDVTRRDQLAPAMEEVERKLGPISILVNNAGIAIMRSALKFQGRGLGPRDRNEPELMFFSFADRGALDGRAQARQDNQYRERVLLVRRAGRNSVRGGERRAGADDQDDGNRARAAQRPGQRDRPRMDRDRHDGRCAKRADVR